ncbi:MAG: thiamine pyrophosphate-dependent enzyme [Pirellulales bacterium]|nr:thiamine pyrophosphate-dependent enzyme [Pirellulales bacterium]
MSADPDTVWRDQLVGAGSAARAALVTSGEATVARLVSEEATGGVFVAASMGIRNLDIFGTCSGPARAVGSNRGASGIDGCVATAAGWSRGGPTTLLIGDQALLHDLSSLPVLREHPVTVVVVNNGGGAIFGFLPIAAADDVFEEAFAGPPSTHLGAVARALGIEAPPAVAVGDFAEAYRSAQQSGASCLIEVITDRDAVVAEHEAMIAPALAAAAAHLSGTERSA